MKGNVYRSHIRSHKRIIFYWGNGTTKTKYCMNVEEPKDPGFGTISILSTIQTFGLGTSEQMEVSSCIFFSGVTGRDLKEVEKRQTLIIEHPSATR